jgi:large subunit ribosomal protein L28e
MVHAPDAIVWELIRHNNCFLKKVNGHSKRSGARSFSVEKGNLPSLNLFKFSGLANSKALDVVFADDNKAALITKTASKAHSYPKKGKAVTPINKDFRRVEKVVKQKSVDTYYRRDLQAAALAKWTKIYQANRRAKGIKAVVPVKKGRTSQKEN